MVDRIDTLRNLLAQDPNDTRILHMLANELANAGRNDEALEAYHKLTLIDSLYVPAFFQAGRLCERIGRLEDAREWYVQGLATAERIGDMHTASEIQEALDLL